MPRPVRPTLALALQFARDPLVRSHRATLTRAKVARWIRAALQGPAEITVRVVGAAEGEALNRDFRGKSYATNVLTFNYSQQPVVVADLVLCAPVLAQEAADGDVTLEAHYAHLIVHGSLHAQGHDHESDAPAAAMEGLESGILLALGYADPYRRAT